MSLDAVKSSLAEVVLAYSTCGFVLAMVFHRSLGLPDYSDSLLIVASIICLFLFLRLHARRIEAETGVPWQHADSVNRWIMPLMAIGVLCAVVALLFEIFHR